MSERNDELARRISEMVLKGMPRWQVDEALRAERDAPTPGEIDAAYAQLVDRWIADAEAPGDESLAWHIAMRKQLIKLALEQEKVNEARQVLKDLGELQNLYLAKQKAGSAPKTEREQRIERLRAKRRHLSVVV